MSVTIGPGRTAHRSHLAIRMLVLLGCAGLVGGIPLLLLETHATPPLLEIRDLVVHPTQVRDALETRVSDGATLNLLWLIAWLTWGWFAVCVVVEIVGRVRGRAPGRLPGSRHVQWLAKCLIGASLAFGIPHRQLSSLRLQVTSVSTLDVHGHIRNEETKTVARTLTPMGSAGVADERLTVASSVEPEPADRTYVVKPGDTLWSIAKSELKSPLAWRQLAAANYGRAQPDGESLTNDHWIRPGWVFVIPMLGNAQAGVARGGTSSLIVSTTSDPPVIGDITGLPEPAKAAATTKRCSVEALSANDCRSVGTVGSHSAATSHPEAGRGPSGPHLPILPIGYGLLGAGIVALLDRMRRAQQRLRPEGLRIALPESDLVELERGLRFGADPGAADWVDLSLRLLSANVRRGNLETPMVSAVLLRDDVVEVILQTDSLPPPPFETGSGDKSWILRKSGQLLDELRRNPDIVGIDAPIPSLVTLGRDSQGIQMINIEIAGSVAVSGPDADLLVRAVAVELATAQWADQIDLVLVGFGDADRGLERVSHASSLSAVSAKMKRRVQERAALLATIDRATNSENRWREGGDSWDLCVVICSSDASADESGALEELIDVAGNGSFGVVVICGRDILSARWRARTGEGRVSVDGVGLPKSSLLLQPVPQGLVERVSDLVAIASQTAGVSPDEEPYGSLTLRIPERGALPLGTTGVSFDVARNHGSAGHGSSQPSDPKILVRVLGPVEIIGAARQFTRAWALELIVYLAVHPGGVSNEQWATALWPEKTMAPASLHSTASAARRSLGTSASGEDHLPRSRGRLALGPGVQTDWDVFVDLSRSPGPDAWREAIKLVVGRPFDDLRSPDWVVLEGIQATVEAGIVDLTCRYARHCLEVFDAPGAEWAARQGLRVSPYDERLYRVLLRAADAAGNPAGVESVMAELVHLVADDIEPFDAVHPETIALYRKLSRRPFATRSR